MTAWILGISCYYHDAAAALVKDGEIVAAAQEERFSRRKHDPSFPDRAIDYCLEEGRIETDQLSAVVYYDNPILTFDRVLKSLLQGAPGSARQWEKAARTMLGRKLPVKNAIREKLGADVPVLFSEHHLSHAASAFYPSPFEEAAVLTLDGVGEWATTSIGAGRGAELELLKEIHFPHSLGLLYSTFTGYCGFKVNSGEYKLMGLAAYGEPTYERLIRDHLIDLRPDGSYRLNLDYFGFTRGDRMAGDKFEELFGGPPRAPESRITRREMDLAASVQKVIEDAALLLAAHARALTGMKDLAMAGGVALNCVTNGKLLRSRLFDGVWVQPAAGDAGSALGGALLAAHRYFKLPRPQRAAGRDPQKGSYLGPAFNGREVKAFLDLHDYPYLEVDDGERARLVARLLAERKVVGYMVGRMEFGPRALGARSILADARDERTQAIVNLKIKRRESFRPFAPSVLRGRCPEYFEFDGDSPYMSLVAPVRKERRLPTQTAAEDLLSTINAKRSDIPAVTHVDYSARIQTVDASVKPDFHAILKEFESLTGCGLVVNTSFNLRGEPIVCSPADAYRCFMRTEMDALVLENCVLYKEQQPDFVEQEDWSERYELD
ncbi:MAG TPA: carbamoyltransferase [Pyrinomonadaceae bacterium]